MIFDYIKYPLIGLVECFLLTLEAKFVQRNKKFLAFIIATINIEIWAYVITSLPAMKGGVLHLYALVYGLAVVLAVSFDNFLEKLAKIKGKSFKKRLTKAFNMWRK